jgi:uncharacterized protein
MRSRRKPLQIAARGQDCRDQRECCYDRSPEVLMAACPVCHQDNAPDARLCRRCGTVIRREAGTAKHRPMRLLLAFAALLAATALAIAFRSQASLHLTYFGTKIAERGPDFKGQEVRMKRIDATIHDGWVEVPLHVIEDAKLVQFEVPLPEWNMNMPMIAYIGPTGRLVTAFGWCELCQTPGYHFESNTLVCDKCMTTWALEGDGPTPQWRPSHMGFAGNCRRFGPEFVENEVVDGPQGKVVRISESRIHKWRPRTEDVEKPAGEDDAH